MTGFKEKTVTMTGRHLIVLIPSYDGNVPGEVLGSYTMTERRLRESGVRCSIEVRSGCALITKARNELVHSALQHEDITDLLFVDSDIIWQPDDVMRLMAWATDYPVVGGMYCVKQDEPKFHVILDKSERGTIIQDDYGLIKALGIPAGFMLMRRHALLQAAPNLPVYRPRQGSHIGERITAFFDCYLDEEAELYYGEDIEFCRRMTKNGIDIWIDPAIELKHIGKKAYDHNFIDYIKSRSRALEEVESAA